MDRRTFVTGFASGVALSGCLGLSEERVSHETKVFYYLQDGAVLENGVDIGAEQSDRRRLFGFATEERVEESFDFAFLESIGKNGAINFIRNTSFDGTILAVYQHFPSPSGRERSIYRSEWDDGTVRLFFAQTGLISGDSKIETVLVRIDLAGNPIPETVFATDANDWEIEAPVE